MSTKESSLTLSYLGSAVWRRNIGTIFLSGVSQVSTSLWKSSGPESHAAFILAFSLRQVLNRSATPLVTDEP